MKTQVRKGFIEKSLTHMLYRLPSLAKQSEYIFKTGFHILKKVIERFLAKGFDGVSHISLLMNGEE